jgi:CBS-domain-containing membrane protein
MRRNTHRKPMPTAADLMRRDVIVLAPADCLAEARATMRLGRIRQLPVVEEPWLVGEVSWRAACKAYRPLFEAAAPEELARWTAELDALPVARVMQPPRDWVREGAPLLEVVARLARRACGFVPVVETEGESLRLLGVVTEHDLLRAALAAG